MSRISKALVIIGALLIWYTLFGFLIAPPLVRYFSEKHLQENFSPESAITKVRINPFSGSFRVEGLNLAEATGAWSVAWREVELNIGAATFFKFYPVVDVLRLDGADIHFEKRASEEEIVEEVAESSGDWRDVVNDLNLAEIPELRIDLLQVSGGRLDFVDLTAAEPYEKTIDPVNFTLRDLTTVVEGDSRMSFVAETDEGAVLSWKGDFQSQPIRSSGRLSLSGLAIHDLSPYFVERIRFNLERAVFGFGFDYVLDLSDLENLFSLQNGQVSFTEVLCEPSDATDRLIKIDSIVTEGIEFQFPQMALNIGSFRIADGETRIFRDEGGEINLARLVAVSQRSGAEEEAQVDEPVESSLPALSYVIQKIALSNYRIIWEEALAGGAASLTVDITEMEITDFTSDLDAPFQLKANYLIGESGKASVEGAVTSAGPKLDLELNLNEVPLALLSPYAKSFGQTDITEGLFDFSGRFKFASEGEQTLAGDVEIGQIDFVYAENVLTSWSALKLNGLHLDLSPFALSLEEVALEQPTIVYNLVASEPAAEETEEAEAPEPELESTEESGGATPVSVQKIVITGGSFTFDNQNFEPSEKILMDELALEMNGLDLAGSDPAKLVLSTLINGSSFQVDGDINVSQLKETTRLKASLSGFSLPAFSAYSGKALGRRIASGVFNLESDWEIEASQLKASNNIRIEQMEFGDSVESEDAVSLPLDLAVLLLKGPNGVMDLSLPLSGDLSDPKLGVGQIVRTAFVGLITSVATAPFKLLAGLVGGGEEDLSFVSFEAGMGQLSPAMVTRLNTLATALKERPGLKLAISPQVSADDDVKLSEAELRSNLLGDADPNDEKLYRKRLTKRYRDFMKAAGTPDKETKADNELGLQKMVAALLPEVVLSDAKRSALAAARATSIRDHLLTAQGIAAERLTVADSVLGASESVARFDLK